MLKRLSVVERIRLIEHARLITLSRILSASISLSSPFVFLFPPSLLLSFFLFNRIRSLDSTLDGLRLNDMISPLYSVVVHLSTLFLFSVLFSYLYHISSIIFLEFLQNDAIALSPFPFTNVPTNLNLFIFGSFFLFF